MPLITRRRFLSGSALLAGAGIVAGGVDATIFEPNEPRLVRLEVPLARLHAVFDGFTIAQLSDFHYDERFSAVPIRKGVEIVNQLKPDLVVLTGDFVTIPMFFGSYQNKTRSAAVIEPCAQLLSRLEPRIGTFAILGNHDAESDVPRIVATLQASNIPVLRNSSVPIEREGARFWLCGLDDALTGRYDVPKGLRGIPADEPVVVLLHEPDLADVLARYPVDLQLSGHSHGGQVRFPLIGAPVLPPLARKYPWGLRQIHGLALYTNVGLGTIRLPVRFDCPPEVTLLTLRSQPTPSPDRSSRRSPCGRKKGTSGPFPG